MIDDEERLAETLRMALAYSHDVTIATSGNDALAKIRGGGLQGEILVNMGACGPDAVQRGWQKDYFQGKTGEGTFREHQTRLDLPEFAPPRTPRESPDAA